MHTYKRSSLLGEKDGKPALAYKRDGCAAKGEPPTVFYWRTFVSVEKRDWALFDPKQETITR